VAEKESESTQLQNSKGSSTDHWVFDLRAIGFSSVFPLSCSLSSLEACVWAGTINWCCYAQQTRWVFSHWPHSQNIPLPVSWHGILEM